MKIQENLFEKYFTPIMDKKCHLITMKGCKEILCNFYDDIVVEIMGHPVHCFHGDRWNT